jgi:TonB family protein
MRQSRIQQHELCCHGKGTVTVKYKVLIKRCESPVRAAKIAEEIARWSGSTADVVYAALVEKSVCIRKEAEEDEAMQLKKQFEAAGAQVELVTLQPKGAGDDDEEAPGRILTDQEFAAAAQRRDDIFSIDRDTRVRNIETVSLLLALVVGFWMVNMEITKKIQADFLQQLPQKKEGTVKVMDEKELKDMQDKMKEEEKKKEELSDKKKMKPAKKKGAGGTRGGGGDPRARVVRSGVLGIISGKIKGKSVASADIFGKGGFATDIDAILSGVGGLKAGGDGGVGRKGAAGIGYGAGYGSGFGGGGSGGVEDILGGLLGGDGSGLQLKKRGKLELSTPEFVKGGALTGGRSRASIMRVVQQNLAALRYAYNKRLREKPGLKGRIQVKFAIDEFGKVIFCKVLDSTMDDPPLEEEVVAKIKRWVFEKIDKPGDVTEVVYPFVFSQ